MRIELLGTAFTIQTDEDPQYVQDLVDYYRTKVQEVQRRIPSNDALKIAIVAGVLTADELFRARDNAEATGGTEAAPPDSTSGGSASTHRDVDTQELEHITQRLIDVLDRSLEESEES
jgi:cell division protein ZapA (FtsZ GTPase activity inhibitor)